VRVVHDAPGGPDASAEPSMDCVDVRDRLTEYALSLLPAQELEPVEAHLAWCAGCRKESAELAGGAAVVALSLPQADPPATLEERVVREVGGGAGGDGRRSRSRGRSRAVILIAATLAILMGLGWVATFGRLQTERQKRDASERTAKNSVQMFGELSRELLGDDRQPKRGDSIIEVQMVPALHHLGGGKALVFLSPRRPDWVLVYAGGLDPRGGPYGMTIQSPRGDVISLGEQSTDTGGGVTMFYQDPSSLRSYTRIVVTDRRGHVALTGTVADRATPTRVDAG
jgi:Putative zinc-finger